MTRELFIKPPAGMEADRERRIRRYMMIKKDEKEKKETVYLTIEDVMQRLHICRNIAYNLIHTPGFPAIRAGRKFFIPEDRFDEYMKSYCGKKLHIRR